MIHSTTELINEILDEIDQLKVDDPVFETSLKKKSIEKKYTKEYATRFCCIQGIFLRSSWTSKLHYLTSFVNVITGVFPLDVLLTTFYNTSGKLAHYAAAEVSTNFEYDKMINSHNRALDRNLLIECEKQDVEWFQSLDITKQISVMIGLLRIGGGAIIRKIYKKLQQLYKIRVDEILEKPVKQEEKQTDEKSQFVDKFSFISGGIEEIKFDPKDPISIELEKQRQKYNQLITKYKKSVEPQIKHKGKKPKEEKTKEKKPNKKKSKQKKSSEKNSKEKKPKGKKSKEKESSSKKGKKGKPKSGSKEECLDRIQLLPIWIVKKIFGYLDKNSIKVAKKVNKYWDYVITDMKKEAAARKHIDKITRKMEETVQRLGKPTHSLPVKPKDRISKTEMRMRKLEERGCIHPKLRIPIKNPTTDTLLSFAPKQANDMYLLPVKQLESFPRNSKCKPTLCKRPSYVCIDSGFVTIIDSPEDEGDDSALIKFTLGVTDDDLLSRLSASNKSVPLSDL